MEKSQDQQRILSQRKLLTLMYKAIMCSAGLQDSFSQNRQIASHGPRGFMAFPKGGDGKLLKKPKISTAIAIRELLKRGPGYVWQLWHAGQLQRQLRDSQLQSSNTSSQLSFNCLLTS
jgi:hypothetical protein